MKLLASIALLIICLTSAQPVQAAPSYTEQEKVVHHLYHESLIECSEIRQTGK